MTGLTDPEDSFRDVLAYLEGGVEAALAAIADMVPDDPARLEVRLALDNLVDTLTGMPLIGAWRDDLLEAMTKLMDAVALLP